MISFDMVKKGYETGIINLFDGRKCLGDGVVCGIGDNWFYFGGHTAEEYTNVDEYKKDIPQKDIIQSIFEALNELSTEFKDEYLYYEAFLRENLKFAQKENESVSLWGRLGVQIDMTPAEFEVLQRNDKPAKDLLVDLIKSDKCFLSGETYFPPEANEEYKLSDLDDYLEFDIDFQSIHKDEFEAIEQTLEEQKISPEIWALRGEISNLRHELEGALIHDPERAPKIEKCLAVRELELNAALEGVKLNLDPDDIIDAEHLDCFWYDGYIGSMEYKGYNIDITARGDVRISVLSEDLSDELAHYHNPGYDDVIHHIKDDAALKKLSDEGRIVFSNNNWLEFAVFDENEHNVTPGTCDTVLDTNNVLEAFADVNYYKEIIDNLVLENNKEVAHPSLEDNIAAAKQMQDNASYNNVSVPVPER